MPLHYVFNIMAFYICQAIIHYTKQFNTALCKVYKFQHIIMAEIFLDNQSEIQYTCINTFFEHNILWLIILTTFEHIFAR